MNCKKCIHRRIDGFKEISWKQVCYCNRKRRYIAKEEINYEHCFLFTKIEKEKKQMRKRWYTLLGVSEEVLEAWAEQIREDVNLFRSNDGKTYALVHLSFIQMLRWKYQIFCSNMFVDHYGFKLKRM